MMQFLPCLRDVESAGGVCRAWRAASASPLVWHARADQCQLRMFSPCGTGGFSLAFADSLAHVTLSQLQQSRLYRNVRTLSINASVGARQLDLIQLPMSTSTLANLTCLDARVGNFEGLRLLLPHPLCSRMRSLGVTLNSNRGFEEWLKTAFSPCVKLRKLRLHTRDDRKLSQSTVDQLLSSLSQQQQQQQPLESLDVDRLFSPLLTRAAEAPMIHGRCWSRLRTLTAQLSTRQVETLCDTGTAVAAPCLPALHTLELELNADADTEENLIAEKRAAVLLHLPSSTSRKLLQLHRLACLSRLPALRQLRIQNDRCICIGGDPMLPLRMAQQRDATAFAQLEAYAYVDPNGGCYSAPVATPTAAAAVAALASPTTAAPSASSSQPVCFPHLAFLELSCCSATLLTADSRDLALSQLCAEVPSVRQLSLGIHVSKPHHETMAADALAWCRSAALRSLRQLHTLRVARPFWFTDEVTARMLLDVHSLLQLPELNFVELTGICQLRSRAEISDLLTLHDVEDSDIQADTCSNAARGQ